MFDKPYRDKASRFVPLQPKAPKWTRFRAEMAVLVLIIAMNARPVPWVSENFYLLRIEAANPLDALSRDWTLTQPSPEHYVFNQLTAPLARVLSVEAIGWIGRFVSWVLITLAIFRLGAVYQLSPWYVALAVAIWLGLGQSLVAASSMIQGFEAKSLAYPALVLSLAAFAQDRLGIGAVLIGAAFSLHPGVGLWAMLAVFPSLMFSTQLKQLLISASIAVLFALPGAIPVMWGILLSEHGGATDWGFMALVKMPKHLDPLSWSEMAMLSAFIMLAFNLIHAWYERGNRQIMFLARVQFLLAAFFVGGLIARLSELCSLLRFMPFRLFPLLVPLLFFFHLFAAFRRGYRAYPNAMWLVGLLGVASIYNPLGGINNSVRRTYWAWAERYNGETILDWIAEESPHDARFIAPPWMTDFWYRANRPQVVSYHFPPYASWDQWRERLESLGADISLRPGGTQAAQERLERGFQALDERELLEVAERYDAKFLLSDQPYAFPVIHSEGGYKVYRVEMGKPVKPDNGYR